MKIINANANFLDPTGMHPYAFMERVGRTCYKSEDKITDVSAVKFISALKNMIFPFIAVRYEFAVRSSGTSSL